MRHAIRITAICLILVTCLLPSQAQQQPQAVVNGQLLARANNQPASGLTVSLVHPRLGRSVPTTSNYFGNFSFFGIPLMHDPYYMEVYWGNQLVYRQMVVIDRQFVNLPPNFI